MDGRTDLKCRLSLSSAIVVAGMAAGADKDPLDRSIGGHDDRILAVAHPVPARGGLGSPVDVAGHHRPAAGGIGIAVVNLAVQCPGQIPSSQPPFSPA